MPFSLKYSVRNYNGTWQHQIIIDQIKSEVVNDMHPVNNGGILETQCRKGKHYFLYAKCFQSYTYHQSFLLCSKLFSISNSEDLHLWQLKKKAKLCITIKKNNRLYYWSWFQFWPPFLMLSKVQSTIRYSNVNCICNFSTCYFQKLTKLTFFFKIVIICFIFR